MEIKPDPSGKCITIVCWCTSCTEKLAARRNSGKNISTSGSNNAGTIPRGNEGIFLWVAPQAGLPPPNSSRDRQAQLIARIPQVTCCLFCRFLCGDWIAHPDAALQEAFAGHFWDVEVESPVHLCATSCR